MEFFSTLEEILTTPLPQDKIQYFSDFYAAYKKGLVKLEHTQEVHIFSTPSFASICHIVPATQMQKRTALSTTKGKAYLIHAIAHIEYSAIDLALDHAYRFRQMPKAFYDDWLEVAEDEIRHFLACEALLKEYEYAYGDFDVHAFLFDVSQKTLDLVTRMAVVPRHLEASGLDANPQMIAKLSKHHDSFAKKAVVLLEMILKEEVSHVKKGDVWFKWACQKEGIDPRGYFDIVESILPGAKKKKPFINVSARQAAGFSCVELKTLSDVPCEEKEV